MTSSSEKGPELKTDREWTLTADENGVYCRITKGSMFICEDVDVIEKKAYEQKCAELEIAMKCLKWYAGGGPGRGLYQVAYEALEEIAKINGGL